MQCPKCRADNDPNSKFCSSCGENLSEKTPAAASSIIGGERRQVTALFVDVVDSTPLAAEIGEEALFRIMQDVIGGMVEAVKKHGGTVEKLTGDGLLALFGAPMAVEEAPLNACRAGLDVLQRMCDDRDRIEIEHGQHLHLRIGVNTGHAVVGSLGTDLQQDVTALGDSVNVASRLEGLAEPDTMVIGESTYQLVADFVDAEFAGEHSVKGKIEPQKIWRVDALKLGARRFDASLTRGLTALVGRRREVETMLDEMSTAVNGALRIIQITGDAGIGKSRLVHEFQQRLPKNGTMWLQGNCTESGRNTPYLPFIEVVRSSFRIAPDENSSSVERKLKRGLRILGIDAEDEAPYLQNLLGHRVDGAEFTKDHAEIAGIRTRNLLERMVVQRCQISPTVLFIDDLHWMDSASEALLFRLIENATTSPLLLIFACRPEYHPPWSCETKTAALNLTSLSPNSTEELLHHRLGVEDLPRTLVELVIEKSEGNPLFAEEIANYLVEQGGVSDDGNAHNVSDVALPVSLENLLMARVDSLEEGPKRLLQVASVIGRNFAVDLAGEVAGSNGQTSTFVAELERMELIRPANDAGGYQIKHALTQDAVYDSLLRERREELHERVATAIERRHRDRIGEIAETLAHHYGHTPRAEKAVRYMAQAGEKSLRVYSLDEAELRLRQVVELIEKVPGCADDVFLTDVLLNVGRVQYFRADMYGLIELLEPHLRMVEALGDPKRLSRFLFEIGYAHVFSANPETGIPMLKRAQSIAEENDDEHTIGLVKMGLSWGYSTWRQNNADARRKIDALCEEAECIGRKFDDMWLVSKAIVSRSVLHSIGGNPGESNRHALRLLELSRKTGDPRAKSMGLWAMAIFDSINFAHEAGIEAGSDGAQLALCVVDHTISELGKSIGLIMSGNVDDGLPLAEASFSLLYQRGLMLPIATTAPFIGVGLVMAGDMADGERQILDWRTTCAKWNSAAGVLTANLVLGEIYTRMALGADRPPLRILLRNFPYILRTMPFAASKARKYLEEALDHSRQNQTTSFTAWVLYDLALLDRKAGRKVEADEKLTEARALSESVNADALSDLIAQAASS
ncbi:MAG: AAA family ATPase [Rhodospirillales bacterium]|nr:AAA family ATPase [Rhodospirillales bacterium]